MKIALSIDDFTVTYNRLELLLKLKNYFPNFKVSLFIIPYQKREDYGPTLLMGEFLKEIKKHLDWMQFIPHGYAHQGSEMRGMSYEKFKFEILPLIRKTMEEMGLPYENGFKGPHWMVSNGVVKALDEEGWWGAIDPRQPNMCCPKKFYCYTHAIDQEFPKQEVLKLHGHLYGTRNDLGLCLDNLLSLPSDADWHFVTDFVSTKETKEGEK